MKNYVIAFIMLTVLCGLAVTGRAMISDDGTHRTKKPGMSKQSVKMVSPHDFQPIRASILDDNPHHFKIDVKKLANLGANDEAPVFAVYTQSRIPSECADFRKLEINYKKPSEYERVFDLSQHKDVLNAINDHGCVVMRNIPPKS